MARVSQAPSRWRQAPAGGRGLRVLRISFRGAGGSGSCGSVRSGASTDTRARSRGSRKRGAVPDSRDHGDDARGRGPHPSARLLPRPRTRRRLPQLGDPAARAAQPAQRHRRPPAGRAAPAAPPRARRPGTTAPLQVVVAPVRSVLQPQVKGLGDLEPVELQAGDERPARRRRRGPRRRGLHPRRPGRAARRVRGARRHRRRLPADRGAPAPGGVLGRHGRGDPLVRGRRPAQPRDRRARALGAAVPRAAAHRRGARAGRGARRPAPRCRRDARQDRRGHRRRGHGVAGPGAGRRHGDPARPAARRHRSSSCDPERVRTRAHDLVATSEEFLERRLGQRRGRQRRARSTCRSVLGTASYRTLAELREHAREPRHAVVDLTPFAPTPSSPTTTDDATSASTSASSDVPSRSAATPTRPSPTSRRLGAPTAGRSLVVTAGHGLAQRMVEVLGEHDVAAPAGRRRRRPEPGAASRSPPARSATASSPPARGWPCSPRRPHRPAGGHGTSTKDMRRMPSRRRNQVDPLAAEARRLRRPRAARRRPVRRDGAAQGRRRHPRVPRPRVRARPSAASPATGSTCRPTSSTRSPATSAASSPPSTGSAAPTGPRPRAGAKRYVKQIAAELIKLYAARQATAGPRVRRPTPRGSASSRTPSRSSRPPTS